MADKRKQSLRIQLPPGTHEQIIADFNSAMDRHVESQFIGSYAWRAKIEYQKRELLSKFVGPDTDPASDRKARAIEKWLATEDRNRRTNQRLYGGVHKLWKGVTPRSSDVYITTETLLDFAGSVILRVIGPEPTLIELQGSFSGGASTRHKREVGVAARKFTGQADVTPEAWPYVLPILVQNYGWASLNPEVLIPRFVEGNVMFTVPKSTSIDRVACKEPDLNMFAQKACGDLIRARLKRVGIDLNDQSINQRLAEQGSANGKFATIDLSSASDSVSTSLVARLLPPGWFVLLNALRCKRTVMGDSVHENEMFSSMGNGFTFELESLIFWALARAIAFYSGVRGTISVYGDDIIVPASMGRRLTRTFSFFGFIANAKKSYWNGPFRESCGYHGWLGLDVTPIYVKEPIQTQERLIHFLNRLRRWAVSPFDNKTCDSHYWELWAKWSKLVDSRFYGGDDTASPSALVSRHKPRFKLVRLASPAKKTQAELQLGLYLQSLNALARRQQTEPSGSYHWMKPVRPRFLDRIAVQEASAWAQVASFPSASQLTVEREIWVARRDESTKYWVSPEWWEESHIPSSDA